MPVVVTRREFEHMVHDALSCLPEEFRRALDNVALVIEREPRRHHRRLAGGRTGTLFGFYEGVPLTQRTTGYGLVPPDVITLFQGPICRAARDRRDVARIVRETVLHELAHYFGIDDQRLLEIGRY
jgi:predicted Zn-dependent protease with MMP-like domain